MQDFAYLFNDSVAAWLRGRGDARFQRYERHYRAERVTKTADSSFDLETSNERYAQRCSRSNSVLVRILDAKAFKSVMLSLALLWGGSLLVPIAGKSQPVVTGTVLAGIFVALRVKGWRGRSKGK